MSKVVNWNLTNHRSTLA